MVNLSSNNSNNINLSGQPQRNVNISTQNTNNVDANTMGNSQRARSWAIGEGLIDGEDYSAKHYAQLAKVSEDIASGAIADIGTAKDGAILEIETETASKIVEINSTASSFEADLTLLTQRAETAAADAQTSADYIVNNAPEATIQQTSTGAIITTKDLTHGITTATILNGVKGDKGDKGEKGVKGDTGATGNGVLNTQYISTSGLVDTYHINYTNGNYDSFTVTNGANGTGSVADVWVNGVSVLDGDIAKIDLTNFVTNSSLATNSINILGVSNNYNYQTAIGSHATAYLHSVAVGYSSLAGAYCVAVGSEAVASGNDESIAIGRNAEVAFEGNYSIQLGNGTNSTPYSFAIGFNGTNYQLLDGTTGLIPDERISTNIARTSQIVTPTYDSTNERITW